MSLEDFLMEYPLPTDADFAAKMFKRKEFYDLKLDSIEQVPEHRGEYLKHQQLLQRFVSPYTKIQGLLLFHATGSGKTCTTIAINEQRRTYQFDHNLSIKKTVVLVKGKSIINNWIDEISLKCTRGQYIPENTIEFRNKEKMRKERKKLVKADYELSTYGVFVNSLGEPGSKPYAKKVSAYNDTLIIIDEIQNIRIQPGKKQTYHLYNRMFSFLHQVKRAKILLLSATPMWDQSNEIASVMNLILPENKQLPTGSDFDKLYLTSEGEVKKEKIKELKQHFRGYISYIRSTRTTAKIEQEGIHKPWFKHLIVYPTSMSKFQAEGLEKASQEIKIEKVKRKSKETIERQIVGGAFHVYPRHASNFVGPDISYKRNDYKKYIDEKNFLLKPKYRSDFKDNLRKYSAKFYSAIQEIIKNPTELVFVYTEFVTGAGAILFAAILNLFGYQRGINPSSAAKRYALITSVTTTDLEVERIKNTFNKVENANGELIQVLIGSEKIGQGITLKRVKQIHILTPHWNIPSIEQAIGRALRLDSHLDMIHPIVKIYRHVAVKADPPESTHFLSDETNDIQLYKKGEKKDFRNKAIERIIKESSIDCALTYSRNVLSQDVNNSRECDYRQCNYICDGLMPVKLLDGVYQYSIKNLNTSTYDLLYTKSYMNELTEKIKDLFKKIFYIKTEDLFAHFRKEKPFVILKTIDYLISNRVIIYNAYGFPCYIKEDGDLIFLDTSVDTKRQFSDAYYVEHPFAIKKSKFEDIIIKEEFNTDLVLVTKIGLSKKSKIDKLLNLIHYPSIILLVESAYKIFQNPNSSRKAKEMANYILEQKGNALFHLEDGNVVHRMYIEEFKGRAYTTGKIVSRITGKMRCWNQDKLIWVFCTSEQEDKYNKEIKEFASSENERMFDKNNTWGFYGKIINKTGKFKIVRKTEKGKRSNTGIVCESSVDKETLIKMFLDAKINPPLDDTIKSLSRDILLAKIKSVHTDQLDPFLKDLSSKDDTYLRTIIVLISSQRKQLCKWIKEWLEKKDYIIIV